MTPRDPPRCRALLARTAPLLAALQLAACGSGDDGPTPSPPAPPPPPLITAPLPLQFQVSAPAGFALDCGGALAGTLYVDSEVEPHVAVNPANALNLVGAWQQDRWSGGAAQGVLGAFSIDGGASWTRLAAGAIPPFSRCTGGTPANGGDYERATDPWVSIGADGTAYLMVLAVRGAAFAANSSNAMRVARSRDGGRTWEAPATLRVDGASAFNDKNSLTADPTDARYAYAAWDRLTPGDTGPAWLARTVDGGATWEPARAVFDPGIGSQTIGAVLAVAQGGAQRGTVVLLFTQIDGTRSSTPTTRLRLMRSADQGATWAGPFELAAYRAVGTVAPQSGLSVRDGALLPQIASAPDGTLYAVWQDARFTGGQIDGIALSRSLDGGLSWSAPVQVNRVPTAAAFVPQVAVRADGAVAVTYYDLRSDTADPGSTGAELWLAVSRDSGATWRESRVAGPFDLALAPNARGLFLGDYQGLAASGTRFVPFFALATGNPANRTDVFAVPLDAPSAVAGRSYRAATMAAQADRAGAADARARATLRRVLAERGRLPAPALTTP